MGGGGTQTTVQQADPWSGQQPYLTDLFANARGLHDQGPREFFPGPMVAPFSPQSQLGMDMITARALGGSPQQDAFGGYLAQQLGQPNINPAAMYDPAMLAAMGIGPGQDYMAGAGDVGADAAGMVGGASGSLYDMTGYGGLSTGQLAGTAGGHFLGSNPYLDDMYNVAAERAGEQFQEQTMPGIAALFGGAGRTGGGIQQEVAENATRQFGRDLQGMAADIYAPAYESERDRMLAAATSGGQLGLGAAGELGGLGIAGGNLGLQAGQGLGQLGMAGIGSMNDLYEAIGQNQFRAGSLVPGYTDLQYGDLQRLMGVGGMLEDQSQRLIDENVNRWMYGQDAPWQDLQNYASVIYGLPGTYGTTTGTQPTGSRAQGAIGGAMAGGSMFGPWGALGGALLGGIL